MKNGDDFIECTPKQIGEVIRLKVYSVEFKVNGRRRDYSYAA